MRIIYAPDCDDAWRAQLGPWGRRTLAALHRQGRHLRDKTDHAADRRWRQAGVRTRIGTFWYRTARHDSRAHERVVIQARAYGFDVLYIRRAKTDFAVNGETGEILEDRSRAWKIVAIARVHDGRDDERAYTRHGG